ncbi:hypothetical protein C8R43DRAFT_964082 [Mycena crocata]|nr:hypothetical protein C8R43DRAFT_964082 [Mycena crocata]
MPVFVYSVGSQINTLASSLFSKADHVYLKAQCRSVAKAFLVLCQSLARCCGEPKRCRGGSAGHRRRQWPRWRRRRIPQKDGSIILVPVTDIALQLERLAKRAGDDGPRTHGRERNGKTPPATYASSSRSEHPIEIPRGRRLTASVDPWKPMPLEVTVLDDSSINRQRHVGNAITCSKSIRVEPTSNEIRELHGDLHPNRFSLPSSTRQQGKNAQSAKEPAKVVACMHRLNS